MVAIVSWTCKGFPVDHCLFSDVLNRSTAAFVYSRASKISSIDKGVPSK